MIWRKPPKETEKSTRWASMTLSEGGTFTTSGMGPGSYILLNELLVLPFRLLFLLLRLPVRTVAFLIRTARGRPRPGRA